MPLTVERGRIDASNCHRALYVADQQNRLARFSTAKSRVTVGGSIFLTKRFTVDFNIIKLWRILFIN